MKNKIIIILLTVFFIMCNTNFVFCTQNNNDAMIQNDSVVVETIDSLNKGIVISLISGLGIATGSTWGYWEYYFSIGTVFALGLEIPFSKSNDFAFQLYYHYWISKCSVDRYPNQYYWKYIQLSNELYSGYGLSGVFKYYINIWANKFRISFHLGYLFLSENTDHAGIDFGSGLYYSINENWIINLSRNLNFGHPNLGGNSKDVPNLLMLNIYYNIY